MKKYCNLIKKSNPLVDKIFWVIESDEDPYSSDCLGESEISHETRLMPLGNHAHLIVETEDGMTLTNPLPKLYGKQPFYIPYWKQIKSLKEYIK